MGPLLDSLGAVQSTRDVMILTVCQLVTEPTVRQPPSHDPPWHLGGTFCFIPLLSCSTHKSCIPEVRAPLFLTSSSLAVAPAPQLAAWHRISWKQRLPSVGGCSPTASALLFASVFIRLFSLALLAPPPLPQHTLPHTSPRWLSRHAPSAPIRRGWLMQRPNNSYSDDSSTPTVRKCVCVLFEKNTTFSFFTICLLCFFSTS